MAPESERAKHIRFQDMSWPLPNIDLEWKLRYGKPTTTDLYTAASILSAYQELVTNPSAAKYLPTIRKAVKR